MAPARLIFTVTTCLSLAACGGKAPAPSPTKTAPQKQAEADPPAKAEHKAPEAKEGKNPHAGLGGPGMGAPKNKEPGPPRDITPTGKTVEKKLAELKLAIPEEWEDLGPRPPMRVGQYNLPGPGGDAELVVYRFQGGAGGVEANIDRWKKMFKPAEGKTLEDISTRTEIKAGDLKITLVDVTGHYVAAVRPGADEKHDNPDSRMLAAVVEGTGDAFYFKGVGPKMTMDLWAEPYNELLKALAVEK